MAHVNCNAKVNYVSKHSESSLFPFLFCYSHSFAGQNNLILLFCLIFT
uniref:Uncharacterized protein n=1 Tax=Arundo donax TaxID=35708 RepID=A0A0A9GK41_ARUDO